MEENRDLLRISREDEGLGVHWNVHSGEEMMGVCVALATCTKQNETFLFMLLGTIKEVFNNAEFSKQLEQDCIEMPDFESILKDNNHE